MDQLKIFLAVVKKYQFWFLCGVILITSLVCWWLAKDSLVERFKTRKSQIESAFQGTKVMPNHPNQEVIKKIQDQDKLLKEGVNAAWKILYEEQEKNYTFPPQVFDAGFIKEFKALRPQKELASVYLGRYQNRIKDYLPTLKTIVNALHPIEESKSGKTGDAHASPLPPHAPLGGPGTSGSDADAAKVWTGIVDWNGADYANLESRFWMQSPSTFEVVLAQEDLWVYEALLRVIAKVNKGATTQGNASIKRIDALEIGKDAEKSWKEYDPQLFSRTGAPAAAATPPGGSGATGLQAERDRMMLRYVDAKGQPLPVEGEYPYVKFPSPQFKMMPIHLGLMVDQRDLPKLLVECANSSMMIEIRRLFVKENVTQTSTAATPGRSEPSNAGSQPAAGSVQEMPAQTDVSVHILGVVYIFNSPDFGKPADGAAAADGSGVAPANGPVTQP